MEVTLEKELESIKTDTLPDEISDIARKIISLEKLPTQAECITAMRHIEALKDSEMDYGWLMSQTGQWLSFCKSIGAYIVVHDKLVNDLYNLISRLAPTNAIDVCAGNGKLAYWLNLRGIKIKATDDYSWLNIPRPPFVEKLNHSEALKRYDPDLVIACFPDERSTVPIDVLRYPSVRYFIHLGNAGRSEFEWDKIEKMKNVVSKDDEVGTIDTYPTFDDCRTADRSWNKLYEVKENEK